MTSAFLPGFALSLTLILAIGAQNAFVLRQGLKQQHVFWVCATCALSDALLIAAGVAGFGALGVALPWFEPIMRYGGAAFLIWYGRRTRCRRGEGAKLLPPTGASRSLYHTILTLLALTWLNPHVYLDTVVLLGSISAQYQDRLAFGIGAVSASFIFFFRPRLRCTPADAIVCKASQLANTRYVDCSHHVGDRGETAVDVTLLLGAH